MTMHAAILVVDPDIGTRAKFYEILSSLGHQVTCVPLAKEALLRLNEERPDLILLDEGIPDLGGIETAKRIREFDRNIKIILLYKEGPRKKEEQVIKSINVQAVVRKDFSTHLMMKEILEILKEKEPFRPKETPRENLEGPILVVDDNADIRDVLWNFLDRKGYRVIAASSGEEALIKIKMEAKKPRIVPLDMRMPGTDGIIALRKIKDLDNSIKVVMLTSAQEEYIKNEADSLGACDYLTKPCNLEELDALITSLLISN